MTALLQCIPWMQGATYKDICTAYTEYVTKKYGEAIIVFDGYSESSTKDMVHQRRAKGHASVTVTFTEDMKFSMKEANFLANSVNKQQFINMLGSYPEKKCKVYHASGDADVLIVQKTPLQQFLTFSFSSQRERKAVKDERNHHGAMDRS